MKLCLVVFLYILALTASKMLECPSNHFCNCGKTRQHGNRYTAICNGENKPYKLYKIPKFPSQTSDVVFINNCLTNISRDSMYHLTQLNLTHLSLKYDRIKFITSDAFIGLQFLQVLDISGNNMSQKDVSTSLYSLPKSIKQLNLNHMLWYPFQKGMFDGLSHTSVYKIELSHSYLNPFNGTWFENLTRLKKLDISWNSIQDYNLSLKGLNKLEWINLEGNWINIIPDFCRDNITYLKTLFLSNTKLYTINHLQERSNCLRRLKYINLSGLSLRIIPNNIFVKLQSLKTIIINKMSTQLTKIHQYAFNSYSLQNLTFSRADGFRFSKAMAKKGSFYPNNLFKNCPNLLELDLSHNIIEFTSSDIRRMFNPLKNLKKIWLESIHLMYMPRDFFHRLPSLEVISMEKNMLTPWKDGSLFNGLKHLKHLNLRNNQIGMIYPSSFPDKILNNLTLLDLTYNFFSCNCDLMWFRNWIKTTKVNIVGKTNYQCDDKTKLVNYNPTVFECNIFVISVSLGCSVGLIIMTTVLIYFCRWRIRFQLYNMRSLRLKYQKLNEDQFVYAAYVIYCYEDFAWVKNKLIPKTEEELGFKLCIPHRDFELGKNFADNIVEHMYQSKTVIPVLSNNFCRNEWCLFQLAVARNKLTKQGDFSIFPILLEEIKFKNMNAALYNLIKMSNYAAWDEDEMALQLFWSKVLDNLRNRA